MSLKELFQWETPVTKTGLYSNPQIYLLTKTRSKTPTNRFVFNSAWVDQNVMEDSIKKILKDNNKVGISISIDRKNKVLYVVINPPKDIPQFVSRNTHANATNLQITNMMLVEDLWGLFDMPTYVPKQFFNYELFKEEDGHKIWKLWYDPKKEENMQIMANQKVKK